MVTIYTKKCLYTKMQNVYIYTYKFVSQLKKYVVIA